MQNQTTECLTAKELAKRCSVTPACIERFRQSGRLPATKSADGEWLYPAEAVDIFFGRPTASKDVQELPLSGAQLKQLETIVELAVAAALQKAGLAQ